MTDSVLTLDVIRFLVTQYLLIDLSLIESENCQFSLEPIFYFHWSLSEVKIQFSRQDYPLSVDSFGSF